MADSFFTQIPGFLSKPSTLFRALMDEISFEQRQLRVQGKIQDEPRLTSTHALPSAIHRTQIQSNSVRTMKPMTPTLLSILDVIKSKFPELDFDFVLVNQYRNGADKVGWHSDDEEQMQCETIASLSLGGARTFRFRRKDTKQIVFEKLLCAGALVLMKEGCQQFLEHEVPSTKKDVLPRINLTFRKFK